MVASVVILYRAITNIGSMCKVHAVLVNAAALVLQANSNLDMLLLKKYSCYLIITKIVINVYCPSYPLYSKIETVL